MEASPCHMGCAIITDEIVGAIGSRCLVAIVLVVQVVRGDDVEQIEVQPAIGGEDLPVVGVKGPAAHVGDHASSFGHDHCPGRDVPRRDTPFPVSFEPASRDIAEIEGGRARLPDSLNASQEVPPDLGLLCAALKV